MLFRSGRNGEPGLLMKTVNLREGSMPQPSQGPGRYRDLNYNVDEAFDRPYPMKWTKSEHGDYDALARLPDGSPLSISFEHITPYEVAVSFTRGHSLDVTGEYSLSY